MKNIKYTCRQHGLAVQHVNFVNLWCDYEVEFSDEDTFDENCLETDSIFDIQLGATSSCSV